ncbi:MAG: hypothetical protein GYB66_08555 [Chloroflexi bacterium]|nr:hypothetical protein [Chloroflexota bacterium]
MTPSYTPTLTATATSTSTFTPSPTDTATRTPTPGPVTIEPVSVGDLGLSFDYPENWEAPVTEFEGDLKDVPPIPPGQLGSVTVLRGTPAEIAEAFGVRERIDSPVQLLNSQFNEVENAEARKLPGEESRAYELVGDIEAENARVRVVIVELPRDWAVIIGYAPSEGFTRFNRTVLNPLVESIRVIPRTTATPSATSAPRLTPTDEVTSTATPTPATPTAIAMARATYTSERLGLRFAYPDTWQEPFLDFDRLVVVPRGSAADSRGLFILRGSPLAISETLETDPADDAIVFVNNIFSELDNAEARKRLDLDVPAGELIGEARDDDVRIKFVVIETAPDDWVVISGVAPASDFTSFEQNIYEPLLESLEITARAPAHPATPPAATATPTPAPTEAATMVFRTFRAPDLDLTIDYPAAWTAPIAMTDFGDLVLAPADFVDNPETFILLLRDTAEGIAAEFNLTGDEIERPITPVSFANAILRDLDNAQARKRLDFDYPAVEVTGQTPDGQFAVQMMIFDIENDWVVLLGYTLLDDAARFSEVFFIPIAHSLVAEVRLAPSPEAATPETAALEHYDGAVIGLEFDYQAGTIVTSVNANTVSIKTEVEDAVAVVMITRGDPAELLQQGIITTTTSPRAALFSMALDQSPQLTDQIETRYPVWQTIVEVSPTTRAQTYIIALETDWIVIRMTAPLESFDAAERAFFQPLRESMVVLATIPEDEVFGALSQPNARH